MRKNSVGILRRDIDDLSITQARLDKKIKYANIAIVLLFALTAYNML